MNSRADREREFHDDRFSGGASRTEAVGRYYQLATSILDEYRTAIFDGCENSEILEYGCGVGSWAIQLAKRGAKVTAIDISPVAIERAIKRARHHGVADRIQFLEMNAERLEFHSSSFDLVCGMAILHHLGLEPAIAGLAKVLRPTGRAVFVEPLGHNPVINGFRKRTPDIRSEDEQPLLRRDLRMLSGYFQDVKVDRYYFASLAAASPRLARAEPTLVAIDRVLLRVPWLRDHAWQVLVTMQEPTHSK